MTLLQILEKLTAGLPSLIATLTAAGERAPDLKPKLDEWIAALQSAASQENLVLLASALPGEIANIARGRIDPHEHASDDI